MGLYIFFKSNPIRDITNFPSIGFNQENTEPISSQPTTILPTNSNSNEEVENSPTPEGFLETDNAFFELAVHQNDLLDESQNSTVSRMGQSTDSCVADILCDDSTIEVLIGTVLKKI